MATAQTTALLPGQGHRLLQLGIALLLFTSFEGFAIPHVAAPILGRSVHTLSALVAVLLLVSGLLWPRLRLGAPSSRVAFWFLIYKVVAYSSAPTGITAFALMLWGLR